MANYLRPKKNAKGKISYYFGDFYCGRRGRKKVSLKTRDESAARQKFTEYERKFMAGLWDPWTDPVDEEGVTVAEAIERFLKDRERTSSAGNAAFYGHILNPFLLHLKQPNLPLYSLKPERVEKYLRGLQVAESTRRNYTNRFRMFFHWCRKAGLLKEDVAPKPVGGKRGRQKALPKFLTEEQFEQLIRAVEADAVLNANIKGGNQYLIDVFRFTVNSGLRLGEVCNLRWSAVDFASGVFTVANTEEFTTKSGRERSVPLVGEARRILERLSEGRASEGDGYVFKGEKGGKLNRSYLD